MGHDEFTQVAHVRFAPVGLAGVPVAVSQQEGHELLLGALHLCYGIRAAPADIPDHLVLHVGDVNGGQLTGPVQPCQLPGIRRSVLTLSPDFFGVLEGAITMQS
jgi:hypothetical protein